MYDIRYRHKSWSQASSVKDALHEVEREFLGTLVTVPAADGIYCYRSKADKDKDPDGSIAGAVICPSE